MPCVERPYVRSTWAVVDARTSSVGLAGDQDAEDGVAVYLAYANEMEAGRDRLVSAAEAVRDCGEVPARDVDRRGIADARGHAALL